MPYIGNVLTSFAVETGNINDQAVTAPKLSATGGTDGQVLALDSNLNLEWVSDPAGQWVTSGSNIYYNDGNVGIGTTTPSTLIHGKSAGDAKLFLQNTSGNDTGISLQNDGQGTSGILYDRSANNYKFFGPNLDITFENSSQAIVFNRGASESARIDSSGRVGIGTTAPTKNLQIGSFGGNDSNIQLAASTTGASNILFGDASDGDNWYKGFIKYSHSSDLLQFYSAGAINASTGGSERLRIDSSGKVGIGTSSIDEHLHIEGSSSNERIKIENTTSNVAGLVMLNTSRRYDVQVNGSAFQIFDNTGSAERLRIEDSGNVGIGTSSPGSKLEVTGGPVTLRNGASSFPDGVSAPVIYGSTGGGSGTFNESGNLVLQSRSDAGSYNICMVTGDTPAERMRIDSSGRLLVGTSTALTSPTGSRFQVSGNDFATSSIRQTRYQSDEPGASLILSHARGTEASPTILNNGDEVGKIRWNAYDGTDFECVSAEIKAQIDGTIQENQSPSRLLFSTTASGASSPTERLRIDSSGRLLIGSSVAGNADADNINVAGSGNVGITFRGSNSGTGNIFFADSTSGDDLKRGQIVYDHSGNSMRLFTNAVERLRIDSSGRVGIGTTAPSADLDVFNSGFVNLRVRSSGTNTAALNLTNSTRNYSINSSGGALTFFDATVGTERLRIDSSGRVGIGTSSPGNTLHLKGAEGVGIRFENSTSTNSSFLTIESGDKYQFNVGGSGYYTWVTGGSEKARIDNSGRLLIGTSVSPSGGDAHAQNAPLLIQGRIGSDADSGRINLQRGSAATADSSIGTISFTDSSNNPYARIAVEADSATGTNDYPGRIKFQTTENGQSSLTTRLIIKNDGTIQLHNSPGIDFSQIQTNASGMSSELLDSYEEGTFTPVLLFGSNTTGITYNARAGFYVKIGKVVHAWVYINLSSKGSATGAAAISQFPFTSEDINVSGLVNWPGAQPSRRQNETSSNLALQMVDNSINCAITDGAGSNVTDATFTNGTILEFALCYRAA